MIRVLLQCSDTYFVKAFSDYTSTRCRDMEFICFTTAEKAIAYLSSATLRLDAILAEEPVLENLSPSKTVYLLADDKTVFSEGETIRINIYQSASAILSDIKSALALRGSEKLYFANGRALHVVSTFSAQGGSGKTTLAYALAAAAARSGKQCLYINLEPTPALGQLYAHTFEGKMDTLLFALKSGKDSAPILLDLMERNSDHVLVLPPFHSAGDILSLESREIEALLHTITEKTDIKYVFLDLSAGFHALNLSILEQCTCVVLVYTDDLFGRERLQRTNSDIYFKNLPVQGSVLTVLNKCRRKEPEENIQAKFPFSESLQQGHTVADVLERNPAFLKSCTDLITKLS